MSFNQLPPASEIRDMLEHLDPSNRDVWIKVTKILGRCYPGNQEIYEILKSWGSRYSGRTREDEAHERRDFFAPPGNSDVNVGIGALVKAAQEGGWVSKRKNAQDQDREVYIAPAALQTPTTENDWCSNVFNEIAKNASAVCKFVFFSQKPIERADLLAEFSQDFDLFPEEHRRALRLLERFCKSHKDYSMPAFIQWASELAKRKELDGKGPFTQQDLDKVLGDVDRPLSLDNCRDYWRELRYKAQTLLAIQQATEFANRVQGRPWALRSEIAALFQRLAPSPNAKTYQVDETLALNLQEVKELRDPKLRMRLYVPTYMSCLDNTILGWRRGEVSIVAAHSGVGKTWFGIEMALRSLEHGHSVLFCSAEMAAQSISSRMFMCSESLSTKDIEDTSRSMDSHLEHFAQSLKNKNWYLFGGRGMSIDEIEAKISFQNYAGGLDLVIVDYLQLIENRKGGEQIWERVANTMRRLTNACRRYNCAMIVLAQLNNPNKNGGNRTTAKGNKPTVKPPTLYDIADSTAVVRDAAAVVALYRQEKSSNILHCKVLKTRYGSRLDEYQLQVLNGGGFKDLTNPLDRSPYQQSAQAYGHNMPTAYNAEETYA